MNAPYHDLNCYRIRNGMSIRALAREMGVNYQFLRRTLSGETRPLDYTVFQIDRWMAEHADEIRAAVEG